MPLNLDPPADESEFLDWALDRAMELIEEGEESAVDELLSLRPSLREQVRELTELAKKTAFGPHLNRPLVPGYSLLQQLGEGGMGTVWLARQNSLGGRLVAVKVLSRSLGASPRSRARFRAEAQAIGKLRHVNIVQVFDVLQGDGLQAYAMEWVDGSTLAGIIDRVKGIDASKRGHDSSMHCVREALGSAPTSDDSTSSALDRNYIVFVCRVGVAIGRALGSVHRAGLVHRDVKPSNILLRRDGTPLLSDFGLVRDPDSTLVTQADGPGCPEFAGTAAFAAPEQLRADGGEIDRRADIYSLGATLYSALALRPPFEGRNHIEVFRRIQLGLATPLRKLHAKIPRDLQTIVAKAMDHDPERRYQTADEFADDLDRLLNLQPIKAKPAGLALRAVKLARRNRAALFAGALGGVLALGVMTLAMTYFILFPTWSRSNLNEARLVLLDPDQSDVLYSALFFHDKRSGGNPLSEDAADRALSHYDAAVRFAPFDDDIALERELVRVARHIAHRPEAAPVRIDAPAELPLTAEFASHVQASWLDLTLKRESVKFSDEQLQSASADDLRSLGLLALLCGEPNTTMAAWTALDLTGNSDAIVEASFGIVYLINKQYGRAYPRLRKAVEAFPNVGFLTVYLAEAATKCGDFDKAQRWLDQAGAMPRLDRFNGLKRVQAGLHAAAGHDELARQLYEELLAENQNIVAFHDYAQFLDAHGELEKAATVYLWVVGHGFVDPAVYRRFTDVTERWWATLDAADQQRLVESFKPWTDYRRDRDGILPTYAMCLKALGEEPPPGGLPRKPSQHASGP